MWTNNNDYDDIDNDIDDIIMIMLIKLIMINDNNDLYTLKCAVKNHLYHHKSLENEMY